MFAALLDTCVLWPSLQRDFLLSLAVEGLYRPVWSSAILEELEYEEAVKLVARGQDEATANGHAIRLVSQMRTAFADAETSGWEALEGTYGLPDSNDEHVVAAAFTAGAGVIVTHNLKDFPPTSCHAASTHSLHRNSRRTQWHSTSAARGLPWRKSPVAPGEMVPY